MRFFYGICLLFVVLLVSIIPVSAITQITSSTQIGQSNVVSIQYNINGEKYSYIGDKSTCMVSTRDGEVNICKKYQSIMSKYRLRMYKYMNHR